MLTQADLPVIEHRHDTTGEDGVTLEWRPYAQSAWLIHSCHNTAREAEAEFTRVRPFSDQDPEHWRIVVWNRETPGHIRR